MPSALRNPAGTTSRPAESTLTRRDPWSGPDDASGASTDRAGCSGVNLEYAMMFVKWESCLFIPDFQELAQEVKLGKILLRTESGGRYVATVDDQAGALSDDEHRILPAWRSTRRRGSRLAHRQSRVSSVLPSSTQTISKLMPWGVNAATTSSIRPPTSSASSLTGMTADSSTDVVAVCRVSGTFDSVVSTVGAGAASAPRESAAGDVSTLEVA